MVRATRSATRSATAKARRRLGDRIAALRNCVLLSRAMSEVALQELADLQAAHIKPARQRRGRSN